VPDGGRQGGLMRARPDGAGTAVTVAVTWVALIVVSSLYRSDFFSHQTVLAVTFTMAITGVLAVGQSLVALSGGILDLSVPTALILPAYLTTKLLENDIPGALVVVLALLAGGAWGALNATIIVYGKLNPIIVTLATNFAGLAALFLVFQVAQTPKDSSIREFGQGYFLGLPNIWWPMVVLILVVGLLIPRTRYGRRMTAVGGNPIAAKARGISLRRTRYAVFIASGLCGGLAGLIFAASNASFTPNEGAAFLLPVLAAVILAGISLQGGRGNLLLLLLSVGFLSTVPTCLVFFGLDSDWQIVFQGLILIIAVSIDGRRQRSARV
jgi:ribose/xylose/arabinose/galactoside ABC-type transport system permease subunit